MAAWLPLLFLVAALVLASTFVDAASPPSLTAVQHRCRSHVPGDPSPPPPLLRRLAHWGTGPSTNSTVTLLVQLSLDRRDV